MSKLKTLLILSFFLLAAGCGDSEPGSNDIIENNSGGVDRDTGIPEEDGGSEPKNDANDVCEPIETCGGVCGTIDDGCGGTLDCGPCDCIDGVAQIEVCGGCDLGVMQCNPGSTGSGLCDVPDIPGWSGDSCEGLVFVSPEGTAAGTGDKNSPLDSIVAGVSTAKSKDAVGVIIASGSGNTPYEGRVVIDSQISLVGGYTAQFKKDTTRRPVIASNEDEGLVIASANNILVERVEVKVANSSTPSANNYAVRVFDSKPVFLRAVNGVAGRGGAGVAGSAGAQGQNGFNGESLGVLSRNIIRRYTSPGTWTDTMRSEPRAAGGVNEACPDANGGDGGQSYLSLDNPTPASPGSDGRTANGGDAGTYLPGNNSTYIRSGKSGANGEPIQNNGRHGLSGDPNGTVLESTGKWLLGSPGQDGEPGENGSGGGGGGGGVGHDNEIDIAGGSNGGGGGAGGCGGGGGAGGSNGGGSFGLFAVDSEINLENSTFFANAGGDGGGGGAGGTGGLGGNGGKPHLKYLDGTTPVDFLITGGTGGNGAMGGPGGAGGGGAGGPSYGGYCYRTPITAVGINRFVAGDASKGGISVGIPGSAGVVEDNYQCD